MVVFDNLAHILDSYQENNHISSQWRLLGEDNSNRILISWLSRANENDTLKTEVGSFHVPSNSLQVLKRFSSPTNVIQASVEDKLGLLSYTVREGDNYRHFISTDGGKDLLINESNSQIMSSFVSSQGSVKLLVLVHLKCILLHQVEVESSKITLKRSDTLSKGFIWAQFDSKLQALYFIHCRKAAIKVDEDNGSESSPTLSAFQFHPDLPHETVLNIPLNLPILPQSETILYEDDCVPLRVHDCSLDLLVLSDESGFVCICHHYLYQPVKPPKSEGTTPDDSTTVHLAYSITLLHHGCVLHCVVPGVPWAHARTLRPVFSLLGSQYLMVHGPGVFTHLLDIGSCHEPICHIILSEKLQGVPFKRDARWVNTACEFNEAVQIDSSSSGLLPKVMIDLTTLDLLEFEVSFGDLVDSFVKFNSELNRSSILHYLVVHEGDWEKVEELLTIVSGSSEFDCVRLLQEILVGGAFGISKRSLSLDDFGLLSILPMTCCPSSASYEFKVSQSPVTISQEILWNTAMMLLSPRQRIISFKRDIWTRLWERLSALTETPRFKPSQVADKLVMSLLCYQPEALSRCTTPMSPGGAAGLLPFSPSFLESSMSQGNRRGNDYGMYKNLPFPEIEVVTASRQEHVLAVNLREINMYLLKKGQSRQAPLHVNAVASRYVAAQLEVSKLVCSLLSYVAGMTEEESQEKGFHLIRGLEPDTARRLFTLYQQYFHAVDTLAFPLPQGFCSFFAYLGFMVLPFGTFVEYVCNGVLELQVDAMKEILKEIEDSREGVVQKLRLLQQLPRSRAKRLLNAWVHPTSLMIRAREHALSILSGMQTHRSHGQTVHLRKHSSHVKRMAAFLANDRASPLDTFLDLLTAKASLPDLDFNLLIDATTLSIEDSCE